MDPSTRRPRREPPHGRRPRASSCGRARGWRERRPSCRQARNSRRQARIQAPRRVGIQGHLQAPHEGPAHPRTRSTTRSPSTSRPNPRPPSEGTRATGVRCRARRTKPPSWRSSRRWSASSPWTPGRLERRPRSCRRRRRRRAARSPRCESRRRARPPPRVASSLPRADAARRRRRRVGRVGRLRGGGPLRRRVAPVRRGPPLRHRPSRSTTTRSLATTRKPPFQLARVRTRPPGGRPLPKGRRRRPR